MGASHVFWEAWQLIGLTNVTSKAFPVPASTVATKCQAIAATNQPSPSLPLFLPSTTLVSLCFASLARTAAAARLALTTGLLSLENLPGQPKTMSILTLHQFTHLHPHSFASKEGDSSSPPPPASEPLIDDEGYDTNISDIWVGDDRYDIWGEENDDGSRDSNSVVSVIDVPKSPKIIEISSDEDSWSLGSETSNSIDPDYQPRAWNRRRK
ncbi:hypothetical protein Cgig2_026753 [Carnegiea gigantea]|uniref:Uncharacterized protein n=1 Tax=Carnegiea gigantea TaxID=171969 RepID=A0A9Q1JTY5_9CARY|nr:hypothetical protein Cgig2_026753 [Carnegiea gigantea]